MKPMKSTSDQGSSHAAQPVDHGQHRLDPVGPDGRSLDEPGIPEEVGEGGSGEEEGPVCPHAEPGGDAAEGETEIPGITSWYVFTPTAWGEHFEFGVDFRDPPA